MARLLAMLLVVLGACTTMVAAQDRGERLYYEMRVNALGSKSQSVSGILYQADGQPRAEAINATVDTALGSFRHLAGAMLWHDRGWFRAETLGPMPHYSQHHSERPDIGSYRVWLTAGAEGNSWRGELIGREPIPATAVSVGNAMGNFRRVDGRFGGRPWQGWVPADWADTPLPARGE